MNNDRLDGGICTCLIAMLLINILIGGFATNYSLYSLWGIDILWWGDVSIGLIAGQFTIPIAVICCIMRACGIDAPFWPTGKFDYKGDKIE